MSAKLLSNRESKRHCNCSLLDDADSLGYLYQNIEYHPDLQTRLVKHEPYTAIKMILAHNTSAANFMGNFFVSSYKGLEEWLKAVCLVEDVLIRRSVRPEFTLPSTPRKSYSQSSQ